MARTKSGKSNAVIVNRLAGYNADKKLTPGAHVDRIRADMGMFGMAAEYVSRGDSSICNGWKLENSREISSQSDFGMALSLVNKALTSSKEALMKLFHYEDCGWSIPVEIDWQKGFNGPRKIIGEFKPEGVYNPLGAYCYYEDCGGYSFTVERKIVIYAKAINELATALCTDFLVISSLRNLTAYVLAHEVFHAFLDFHLNYAEKQGWKHGPEPYAEFFALLFVKNVLKDNELFEMLVNTEAMRYKWSLRAFIDFPDPKSEVRFARELDNLRIWGKASVRETLFPGSDGKLH